MNTATATATASRFCTLASLLIAVSVIAAPPADFTVVSPVDGSKFRLADAKGKYVALHFLLQTECPFCRRHTRDYAKRAAALPDVVQVFLKPDRTAEIKRWSGNLGDDAAARPAIYRDTDAALAEAFAIPHGYHFHGESVHFPALVLLDPAGKEAFRYVGKDNSDRFSFEQLTTKVAELRKAGEAATHPAAAAK